jgi:hypothetical protein
MASPPHAGHGIGHERVLVRPLIDRDREKVCLGLAAAQMDGEARQNEFLPARAAVHDGIVENLRPLDGSALGGEPALGSDHAGDDRALDGLALTPFQQRFEAVGQNEGEELRLGCRPVA